MENPSDIVHSHHRNGKSFEYDPNFKGPSSTKHSYTDVIFLHLFIAAVVGWIFLGVWGFYRISPQPPWDEMVVYFIMLGSCQVISLMFLILIIMDIAERIICFCITVFVPVLGYYTIVCFIRYIHFKTPPSHLIASSPTRSGLLISGSIGIAIFIIFSYLMISKINRNMLALELIGESNRVIRPMWWSIIYLPITTAFLQFVLSVFAVYLPSNIIDIISLSYGHSTRITTLVHIGNCVMYFWVTFFISAVMRLTMAGAVSTCYWTYDKNEVPICTLGQAFFMAFRYHFGSMALGALTIIPCRLLHFIPWKLLRFFTDYSYVMCAIHGKSLHRSGRNAYQLLKRNPLNYVSLDSTTSILLGVCKVLFVIISCTYLLVVYGRLPDPGRFIFIIGAYFIVDHMLSVYSAAVDTLVICFLEDCERNDGSVERPYFMSKHLMKILKPDNVTHASVDNSTHPHIYYNNY